ncbi:MAG: ATP-binding protein [Planctomycetota bacterium]
MSGSDSSVELRLDFPAAHSAERAARAALRKFARKQGVLAAEIDTMEFVASELLSNAVDHGGGEHAMEEVDLTSSVRMTMRVRCTADAWEMEVSDQGGGDATEVRRIIDGQDDTPDLDDERGRGFFLLRQMVDRLEVTRSPDGLGLSFTASRRYVAGT